MTILEHASTIRLSFFLGVLVVMMILESLSPRRVRVVARGIHTFHNLLLVVINSVALRLIPVLSAVAAANWATTEQWGVLNLVAFPYWLNVLVSLLLFDLMIYGQHVMVHHVPLLWRFHKVHHADLDLDATSGLRFHTVEILFSMALKCLAAIGLGAPPEAIILFEVILNASSIFNHSNLFIPLKMDRFLRWIIVTPDMHRVHHSIIRSETNRNFGFNLPWWDWLFRTYQAQPKADHQTLILGLEEKQTEKKTVSLWTMLKMPFEK